MKICSCSQLTSPKIILTRVLSRVVSIVTQTLVFFKREHTSIQLVDKNLDKETFSASCTYVCYSPCFKYLTSVIAWLSLHSHNTYVYVAWFLRRVRRKKDSFLWFINSERLAVLRGSTLRHKIAGFFSSLRFVFLVIQKFRIKIISICHFQIRFICTAVGSTTL